MSIIGRVIKWQRSSRGDKDDRPIRIGVLGAARIASHGLVVPASQMRSVKVTGIAARDHSRAKEFAKKHNIERAFHDYQSLIDDPEIDAVYIPLPNGLHYQWAMRAIEAGKSVLLEKPCTSNAEEAKKLFALARSKNVALLEAFHFRFHPAVLRMKEIIDSGEIGCIRSISATITLPPSSLLLAENDIRFNYELAGGTLMDLGGYACNIVRWIGGGNPIEIISATAQMRSPQIDQAMAAEMRFPSITGKIKVSFTQSYWPPSNMVPCVEIVGEKGTLVMSNFIAPHVWHKIAITFKDGTKRSEQRYEQGWSTYRYQLEEFVRMIQDEETSSKLMSHGDSIGNMQTIDSIYRTAGMNVRYSLGSKPQDDEEDEDEYMMTL